MGFATHLGSWLLGTVKNTTGTTLGNIRNTGATTVVQSASVPGNAAANTVAFVLPAGAQLVSMQFITTTAFGTAQTITLSINNGTTTTAISGATTITTAGSASVTLAATAAAAALAVNVGPTDVFVQYSLGASTTGTGTLLIEYVVRESDGSSAPNSFNA